MAKYPCEECLVDMICTGTNICDSLIFFSDYIEGFASIHEDFVSTDNRFNRLRYCLLKFGGNADRIIKADNGLLRRRRLFLEAKEKRNLVNDTTIDIFHSS